jgi:FMN phosphatase YigB (HAD superfamily)
MIKTVILDLGNVIFPVEFRRCHDKLARVCATPAAEIPRLIRSTGLVDRFETGDASPEEFMRVVSGVLHMNVDYEQFWSIWSSIFAPEPIIPEAMLEGLARHQRLLLLSNTNSVHFDWIQENYPGLLTHFDDFILSYKVGALKPSPRIYQEAIAQAGCAPPECFFTDDQPPYVEGARREGIDAVQFHSLQQLQDELRARSVLW